MTKEEKYIASIREIEVRLEKGGDLIADLGNIAAVLKKRMDHFFWAGFYFVQNRRLVLGPFQGTPACVFLEAGKGVCGVCVEKRETILVDNVHDFPGHVACDPNSRSEIVVPVFDSENHLRAVLDVDSDQPGMFDAVDRKYLEKIACILRKRI